MRWLGKKQQSGHQNHISYFRALKGVIGMLRNPEGTESVFDIEDGLQHTESYALSLDYLRTSPEVCQLIEERYVPPDTSIEALLELPQGSLGCCFAHHIVDHGFDPDYFRKTKLETDLDYVLLRIRQTHDIWHVVTGFDPSRIGELAVKAFELAQMRRPMAGIICAGGLVRYMLHDPEEMPDVLRAISTGYRLGLAAKPFLAQRWENHWDMPIEEWRQLLGVDPEAADPDRALHPDRRSGEAAAG